MAEILMEIEKTQEAINKTKSWKCKNDLTKHLKKLQKKLKQQQSYEGNYVEFDSEIN